MSVARTVLVTVATLAREVDVVADADMPLSQLMTPVAGALGLRAADIAVTVARAGDPKESFTMRFTETLSEAGVVDGDRLSLHPFSQQPFSQQPFGRQPGTALQVAWPGGEV
jgi:WXG100 protein secretion system (Wss), protein YukD